MIIDGAWDDHDKNESLYPDSVPPFALKPACGDMYHPSIADKPFFFEKIGHFVWKRT